MWTNMARTVTWIRTFETAVPRRFDAYMIYSEQRRRVVDYLARINTWQWISICRSMNAGAFSSVREHSVSTKNQSDLAFP